MEKNYNNETIVDVVSIGKDPSINNIIINEENKFIRIKDHWIEIAVEDIWNYSLMELGMNYMIEDEEIKNYIMKLYNKMIEIELNNSLKEIICLNIVSFWFLHNKILQHDKENFDIVLIDLKTIESLSKKDRKRTLSIFKEILKLNVWKKNLVQIIYIHYEDIIEKIKDVENIKKHIIQLWQNENKGGDRIIENIDKIVHRTNIHDNTYKSLETIEKFITF